MSERSSNIWLGSFIIIGLLIGIAVTIYVMGAGNRGDQQKIVMVFDDSVKGLTIGAPIAMRGVNIGEVTNIRLQLTDSETLSFLTQVEATVYADKVVTVTTSANLLTDALVKSGLRAQLNSQSLLTGLLYVQLDFFPDSEITLRVAEPDLLEIPTIPSPFEQLRRQIMAIDIPTLADNMQQIAESMRQLTSQDSFQQIPDATIETLRSARAFSDTAQETLMALRPQLEQTLASTSSAAKSAEQAFPRIVGQVEDSLNQLELTLGQFDLAAQQITDTMEPNSAVMQSLIEAMEAVQRTSRSLDDLAQTLEAQPEALIRGRDLDGE